MASATPNGFAGNAEIGRGMGAVPASSSGRPGHPAVAGRRTPARLALAPVDEVQQFLDALSC